MIITKKSLHKTISMMLVVALAFAPAVSASAEVRVAIFTGTYGSSHEGHFATMQNTTPATYLWLAFEGEVDEKNISPGYSAVNVMRSKSVPAAPLSAALFPLSAEGEIYVS